MKFRKDLAWAAVLSSLGSGYRGVDTLPASLEARWPYPVSETHVSGGPVRGFEYREGRPVDFYGGSHAVAESGSVSPDPQSH